MNPKADMKSLNRYTFMIASLPSTRLHPVVCNFFNSICLLSKSNNDGVDDVVRLLLNNLLRLFLYDILFDNILDKHENEESDDNRSMMINNKYDDASTQKFILFFD